MKRSIFALILALLIGCSTTNFDSFSSLSNQGILPLSTSNAYIGSNLFLASEFSKSSHFFNFLQSRGAPVAIQLEEKRFGEPNLILYYPMQKEAYQGSLVRNETSYQWIIRGPFRIDRKDYRELARLSASSLGEPAFIYRGQHFRFRPTAEELAAKFTPTPLPTPIPTPVKRKPTKIITRLEDRVPPTPEPWKPLNSDQQAIMMAQGFAERAPNGDVVHTIKGEESFEKISEWYTGTAANAATIAKANGFVEGARPAAGSRVQIPAGMVKQFKALK